MLDGITIANAINNLTDPNPDVRYQAAWALQYIGDERAVSALLTALDDADMNVRMGAAQALGRIGDEWAIVPLLKMMNHLAADERYAAAVAIGRLNPQKIRVDEKMMEILRLAMRDEDVFVRCAAAFSLSTIFGFTIAPKVFEALSRKEVNLIEAAARLVEKRFKKA